MLTTLDKFVKACYHLSISEGLAFYIKRRKESVLTNKIGFEAELFIREILDELKIPYSWSTPPEDRIGVDCWLTCYKIPVDFTIISNSKPKWQCRKLDLALSRGIVPVFLNYGMLLRGHNGSCKDIEAVCLELRVQVALRHNKLNGKMMTPEIAARLTAVRR